MNGNTAFVAIAAIVLGCMTIPKTVMNIQAMSVNKELRIKYFETAKKCYEDSKSNPPLTVICPRITEKDADILSDEK